MSIAKTADNSTPVSASTRGTGSTTLAVAQLSTGIVLVVVGIWLFVLFENGFNGGSTLAAMGAVEIVLGVASLGALAGMRAGRRPGWAAPLSIIGAAFNVAAIVLSATATLMVQYPGGAVILVMLFNDVIIGELVVLYFLTRPSD